MGRGHLDANKREYEITKRVSLASVDPDALLQLKKMGDCLVDLTEALFDLDYPGHYMRRLKSVGITIPSVTGPYAGVDCTLTLLWHSIRDSSELGAAYERSGSEDERFHDDVTAIQSLVTSSAQNDSGLVGSNLRDEQYLPFEGAGAISRWRIEFPSDLEAFDLDSISDVVLQLRYTARDGGATLRTAALDSLVAGTARSATRRQGARSRSRDQGDDWRLTRTRPSLPTGDPGRGETHEAMDSAAAIVITVLVLVPVVLIGGLFAGAALKDGQEDKDLQTRLGIRRRTRLGC